MGMRSLRSGMGQLPAAQLAYRCAVAGRMTAERWVLALRGRPGPTAGQGRILAYHSIGTPSWGVNDVRPQDFERHLEIAVADGWTFATPAEVIAEPDRRRLALTFDDGVASVLANAAPVLRHHGIPATMFVVSGWADGGHETAAADVLDWKGLERLREAGFRLESHSLSHPDFGRLDAGEAERELVESRARLERMLGQEIREFAIPFGQSRNWSQAARKAAEAAGYTTVYAQAVETRPQGTVARTYITRIDKPTVFRAALNGTYDSWEEWFIGPVREEAQA